LTTLKGYPKVLGRPEWKEVLRRWKKLEKAVTTGEVEIDE
jgi:hypothetical protein